MLCLSSQGKRRINYNYSVYRILIDEILSKKNLFVIYSIHNTHNCTSKIVIVRNRKDYTILYNMLFHIILFLREIY